MKRLWNSLLIVLNLALVPVEVVFAQVSPPQNLPATVDTPSVEKSRLQQLLEADRLYLMGEKQAAEQLYRSAKKPLSADIEASENPRVEAITDPELLPPDGRVYWREAKEGFEQKLATKVMVSLQMLVDRYPQFVPGIILYAESLNFYGGYDDPLKVLEKASSLYPDQPDLLKARVNALSQNQKWLEAAVAARQFSVLNSNHPQAAEFAVLAEENMGRFQSSLREQLTGNAIATGLLGALNVAITGNAFGALSAVQTTALLLEGESSLGERIAGSAKQQLELIYDKEVNDYVNELGQKLAKLSGRDFEYEFFVVKDNTLNAFALPGGKVFVNAGAIKHTNSEAELAGLLAHEISHAVLSHGFQRVTDGGLLASIAQYIPLGGPLTDLVMLDYSRDQERQADILGTRILVSAGYAADGLYNLMVTLNEQKGEGEFLSLLSSHPATTERISYLAGLIEQNGYNRYAYEGVEKHSRVKARVEKLLLDLDPDGEKKIGL